MYTQSPCYLMAVPGFAPALSYHKVNTLHHCMYPQLAFSTNIALHWWFLTWAAHWNHLLKKNTDALILPPNMLELVLSVGILKSPREVLIRSFAKENVSSEPATSPEHIRNAHSQAPPQTSWVWMSAVRLRNLQLKNPSRWFWCTWMFENYHFTQTIWNLVRWNPLESFIKTGAAWALSQNYWNCVFMSVFRQLWCTQDWEPHLYTK